MGTSTHRTAELATGSHRSWGRLHSAVRQFLFLPCPRKTFLQKGGVFFVVVVCLILFFGFLLISTETRKTFLEVQNHYQMQKDKNCRILKLGKVKSWTKGDQCH